jgi:hypothetical protein
MALDEKIQHVSIYHNHHEVIDEIREDVSSYFSQEMHVESDQNSQSLVLSTKPTSKLGGNIGYAMARFDNEILYTFAMSDHDLLLVRTEPFANSDLIISRIIDFLKH